jgi:hypothetical protein
MTARYAVEPLGRRFGLILPVSTTIDDTTISLLPFGISLAIDAPVLARRSPVDQAGDQKFITSKNGFSYYKNEFRRTVSRCLEAASSNPSDAASFFNCSIIRATLSGGNFKGGGSVRPPSSHRRR